MHRAQPTVSLLLIVRNEEHNLADCLTPVAPLFDEIIIVDTGSHDATKQIAARFTNHVFDFPWNDDFSAARNESLRRSTGDWIFWLDADDRMSPTNVAKFGELRQQLDDRPRCFLMDTASHQRFACDGVELHSQPRLFRRHSELHWCGRVHEQLQPEPARLGHEKAWTDITIDHLGYQSPAELQRKQRRNLRLLAMDFATDPNNPSTLFHLGMVHAGLGNKPTARKFLQQILSSDHSAFEHVRRVYHALAHLADSEGRFQEALAILTQGLQQFPLDDALLYQKADILQKLGRIAEAHQALLDLLNSSESRERHGGPGAIRKTLVPRKTAELLASQGRFADAIGILKLLLAECPSDARSWHLLGIMHIHSESKSDFDYICRQLRTCPQGNYFAAELEAGWYLSRKQPAPAAERIDWLITELPDAPLVRALRCQLLALQNAPLAARIAAWRDVLRVDPGNAVATHELQTLQNTQRLVAYSDGSIWQTSVSSPWTLQPIPTIPARSST